MDSTFLTLGLQSSGMAERPKSFTERLREREDEEEAEALQRKEEREAAARKSRAPGSPSAGLLAEAEDIRNSGSSDKLHELLERIEPLLEQVHQLYNQFFSGIEKRPPLERRKQLDQTMEMILLMNKPTASLQFKCTTIRTRYVSFAEQWDRRIRQLESVKRGR